MTIARVLKIGTGSNPFFALTASWTANASGDNVTGYKLYAGNASGSYTAPGYPVAVGNVTSYGFQVGPGTWYFALTAVNANGESGFSAEAGVTRP